MFFDTMFSLLVLCRVLIIAGVQTLTIDSQLGTSIEDCFERISIGEQLPPTAIYRNVSELTSKECEHICRQDKQCQVYDYGVGAKGNATCNLSMLDEKEVKEKNLLLRHPDYDVYVRRVLCEQTPPKPIQVLQDDPGPPGPQHRPVFRPDPDDRPLNEDYLISSDIPYNRPQNPYRPDSPSNTGLDYDFPPSYGQHKPQQIPYKPSRPNDKFKPRPQKPIDQNDQLHFQGYGLHRPDLLNDYHAYKPDRPNYLNRPNRRPQDDYNRPDGPIGPPERPIRPDRPYKPAYDYNNQIASGYGQNNQYASNYNNPNDVYVEIYDPPRPYVPIKDRPHQDYRPGYLGYGTYGTYSSQNSYTGTITEIGYGQNDKPIYNRPQNDRPQKPVYGQIDDNQGYQRPEKPQTDFSSHYGGNQNYNRPVNDYGGYGYQKPSYYKPSNQYDYHYNDHSQNGYGNQPSDGYRPQKPNRPYGVTQDGYGSHGSYGSSQTGYGGGQNSYGSSQGSYGSYDSYNQGGYGSYGSSQYGSPYGQNYGSSYGYQNDYDYNRPSYGNDQYNKPYQKPKPEYDYQKPQKPGYADQKPGYVDQQPGYGDQKPGYDDQKPGYGDQNPSYDNKPGYGVTKPTYDDKPSYGNQKPDYSDQTAGYGGQKPGYNDQTSGYGGQKPGYNDQMTGYGGQKPGYSDQTVGYGGQKPGYDDQSTGYGNQKPGYSDQTTGYGGQNTGYDDQTGYNANKPAYSDLTPSYGNQKPTNKPTYNQKPQKPPSRPQKPAYSSSYDGYNNPGANYSDPNRPDVRPVYEYDLDKPGNVPSYIVRPGGEIVTSHPVVIGDYGKHPAYKEPPRISYKACFRRVLAGRRALRSFVRKVYNCDTLDDCKKECATEKRFHCESFNYRQSPSYQGQGLCELMTKPIESFNLRRDFIEDKNYDFYEIDRNSLEPSCAETLRGPGMLHSGFLSSKPPREGAEAGGGWKDRNWSGGGSYYDQRKQTTGGPDYRDQKRKFEEFIPYQIGIISRSNDQDKWGRYGGTYGGNQEYYKDRNDYHKSVTHWGLSTAEPPSTKPWTDFDYNSLGRHFEQSIRSTAPEFDYPGPTFSKPPPTEFDVRRTTYAKTTTDDLARELPISGKTRYGYGSWKRIWANSSGLNELEAGQPKILEHVDRNDVEENKCFSRRRPGMSLSSGAIRRSLLVTNVVECEKACFSETRFKCVSYSYRYSSSHTSDNCYLSERPYRGLDMLFDSGSDVYAMSQQCGSSRPFVESECFWHVRSDRIVSGAAVKARLAVPGLGACEAECIRASGFFCRGFSFRFESPSVDDDDINNCILTSIPSHLLEGNSRVATGHELYSRGNYGRGCEPATYEPQESGQCYLQYDKAAKLTPNAVHASLQTKSKEECANACTAAPFKCLSFSYNNNAPPKTDNCYLSEIRLFDLQMDTDYVHSADDWLFAFDVFNTGCFQGRNNEIASELPHPIQASSEEETFPGTAPSSTGFSDTAEPSGPPTGLSDPPTHFTTGPDQPHSDGTTRLEPTQQYSTRPYPGKDDHSPELPRPIQDYRPRPNKPQIEPIYGPPSLGPEYEPQEPEVERPLGPDFRPWNPETGSKPDLQPTYGPPASSYFGSSYPNRPGYRPGLQPDFGERPDYGPGFNPSHNIDMYGYEPQPKPGFEGGPGYGPMKPGYEDRPGYGPGIKPGYEDRPGHGPGTKPGYEDRPGYGPGIKPGLENRPDYGPGIKPGFEGRPGYGPIKPGFEGRPGYGPMKPGYEDRPGYLPGGPRPQKPLYHGDREDPGQESWRQYTVSGFPCRTGTVCAQNQVSGHWACEPEGGEIGSWDYCCAPTHRCGYSEGFRKPWCYVGSKEDQWRPCSDKYYPYHQHSGPHPSLAQGSPGKRENQVPYQPWRENNKPPIPSYIPHWDKRPGPYLSEADRRYWDELYENGPNAYYDKFDNPLPGYSRVPTDHKLRTKYRQPPPMDWIPVSFERHPQIPGLGAPRYWPVAYLHKSSPPNMTYFRYNETFTTTTERYHPQADIAEARNIDVHPKHPEYPPEEPNVPDSDTERTNVKSISSIFDKTNRDEKKINSTSNDDTKVIPTPEEKPKPTTEIITTTTTKDIEETTEEFENVKYNDSEFIKGLDGKLAELEKSLEVLNIEEAKKRELKDHKNLEAEERQIEALGRLFASRRGTKIILEKRSEKDLEGKNINVDKDGLDFDFGNKFPTENPKTPDKSERRGTVKRISKAELEKDRNIDRSLEVSETTFVRPPRVLSTTENIRQTVVNGKVFYDATIKEQKELTSTTRASLTNNPVSSRKSKNLRRSEKNSRAIREQTESNPTNEPTKEPTSLRQETNLPTDLAEPISFKNHRRTKNYRRLRTFTTNGTIRAPIQYFDKSINRTQSRNTRNPKSLKWISIPNPILKEKLKALQLTDNLKEETPSSTEEPKTLKPKTIPISNRTIVKQNDWKPNSIKRLSNFTKSEPYPNPFNLNPMPNPNHNHNPNPFNVFPKPFNLNPSNLPPKPASNPFNPNSTNPNPTTLIIAHNNNSRKKKVRNVNPIRRVKRVYKKRYNPDEVRRRLLEKEKSVHD